MNHGERRRLALVAGAPDGIGGVLAGRLAGAGYDLVVASDGEDLVSRDGVVALHRRIEGLGRPLDVVNVNVIVGRGIPRADGDGGGQLIDLSVRGAVALAELCLPPMVERGAGGLLLTSSPDEGPSGEHLAGFVARARAGLGGTGVVVAHLVLAASAVDDPAGVARRGVEVLSG